MKKNSVCTSTKFESTTKIKNELSCNPHQSIWQNLYNTSRHLDQKIHINKIFQHKKELTEVFDECPFRPNISPNIYAKKFTENFIKRNEKWNLKMEDK